MHLFERSVKLNKLLIAFHGTIQGTRILEDVTSGCWNFRVFYHFFEEIKCAVVELFERSVELKGAYRSFCNYFRSRAKQIVDCAWCASRFTAGLVYGNSAESFSNQRAFIPDGIHLHSPWPGSREISRSPRKEKELPFPLFEFASTLIVILFREEQRTRNEQAFQQSPFSLSPKRSFRRLSDVGSLSI